MNKLKSARLLKGMSMLEVSKASGLTVSTISNLENGYSKGKPKTIKRLCEALSLDPEPFLAARMNQYQEDRESRQEAIKTPDNAIYRSELTMRCELCGRMIDSVKGLRLLPAEDNPELLFAVCLKDGCYLPVSYIDPDDKQEAYHGPENSL